jgi:hypothetical protein
VSYSNVAEEDLKKTLSIYNVRMHMPAATDEGTSCREAAGEGRGSTTGIDIRAQKIKPGEGKS